MKNPKLANRYANALFEMAEMDGKIEEVFADILLIKNVLKENGSANPHSLEINAITRRLP